MSTLEIRKSPEYQSLLKDFEALKKNYDADQKLLRKQVKNDQKRNDAYDRLNNMLTDERAEKQELMRRNHALESELLTLKNQPPKTIMMPDTRVRDLETQLANERKINQKLLDQLGQLQQN